MTLEIKLWLLPKRVNLKLIKQAVMEGIRPFKRLHKKEQTNSANNNWMSTASS